MSEDIQKIRSPNSPRIDLNQAIDLVKKLHEKIGRSNVKAEVAVGALGYNGLNGAALGALGAISQYALVERNAGNVQVSPLALKILHPVDATQKAAALKESALSPKVFLDIYENMNDMAEDILSNNLIHQRFTPEAAKRAAAVYKSNYQIANLGQSSNASVSELPPETYRAESKNEKSDKDYRQPASFLASVQPEQASPRANMLASFKIPLGLSEAELIFTGERLEPADFDALADYVALFKKQYERKLKNQSPPSVVFAELDAKNLL